MTITLAATSPAAVAADALLIAVMPKGRGVALAAHGLSPAQTRRIAEGLAAVGANGKAGEVTRIPGITGIKAKSIIGVGIGEPAKATAETLRRAQGNAIRSCAGMRKVAVIAPPQPGALADAVTALRLGSYVFGDFKSKDGKSAPAIVLLVPGAVTAEQRTAAEEAGIVADGVLLARDLINTPPNALPPAELAARARAALRGLPVKVKVWDEKALLREGCGGILGVGQGSARPPRLVRMEYAPAGAKGHIALVGKGITFDTGGISIKPAASMDEMKADMSGAAAVIAAMQAIARLELPVRVTGWAPVAENMPGGGAQRPGDVLTTYSGTTVEVLNTDAEGRLILADALAMAAEEEPDLIIDAATLTGAQTIAFGDRISAVMANDDDARARVCAAAERAGESMWPMPLPEDLRASLDSATADIANIGERAGGMLSAGVFLKEFVPAGQPWVHLDIAGPALNSKAAYGYTPKGGTGTAVRTFVEVAREAAAG